MCWNKRGSLSCLFFQTSQKWMPMPVKTHQSGVEVVGVKCLRVFNYLSPTYSLTEGAGRLEASKKVLHFIPFCFSCKTLEALRLGLAGTETGFLGWAGVPAQHGDYVMDAQELWYSQGQRRWSLVFLYENDWALLCILGKCFILWPTASLLFHRFSVSLRRNRFGT